VRVQLSGCPSRRWARDLGARLTRELVAHPGTAHLTVNIDELVQGDEIVLQGVEDRETRSLAEAIRRAVDAANQADADEAVGAANVSQRQAEAVASHIPLDQSGDETSAGAA
jgi:hypothetical protein